MILGAFSFASAQSQGRMNLTKRVQIEKDSVLVKISNLSADQKLIIESLYADYEASLKKLAQVGRDDPQAFRQNMQKANQEKNQMMKEVLDEEQWAIFDEMLQVEREKRRQNRGERGGRNRNREADGGNNH